MRPTAKLWRRGSLQQGTAVLISVKPAPTSTIYSSKILQHLQTFGSVTYFKDAEDPPDRSKSLYRAVFASHEAAQNALDASPLSVEAYHNLTSAKTLDPYNVFGLQQRKNPAAKTFRCDITPASDEVKSKPYKLVTDERSGPIYRALLDAEAPMSLLDGLSAVFEPVQDDEQKVPKAKAKGLLASAGVSPTREEGDDVRPVIIRKHFAGR